jgi:hypothetical protein
MPRSLRREGIVWPGIHHSLDKRNSKRAGPADMSHPTPVTGRRPTPAHYSHPDHMNHSQWYACTCTCIVATLVCHHASPTPSHLARARGRCPAESESRATRETARLEFHLNGHIEERTPTTPRRILYCHRRNLFSLFPRLPPTCVPPRNVIQNPKWAWLVPTSRLPPDGR